MKKESHPQGDTVPGGPPGKRNTEPGKGCGVENTQFPESSISSGSAKRSSLKNNLISLPDLDNRTILGTENERKWPNTENPHIEFQSRAANWRV